MEKKKQTKPCTILPDLYKQWQKCRRIGDPNMLKKITGYSRPIIDDALNYGYCPQIGLAEKISQYFIDRIKKEQAQHNEIVHRLLEHPDSGISHPKSIHNANGSK